MKSCSFIHSYSFSAKPSHTMPPTLGEVPPQGAERVAKRMNLNVLFKFAVVKQINEIYTQQTFTDAYNSPLTPYPALGCS